MVSPKSDPGTQLLIFTPHTGRWRYTYLVELWLISDFGLCSLVLDKPQLSKARLSWLYFCNPQPPTHPGMFIFQHWNTWSDWGLFQFWYTWTNFENNKVVAPMGFEFVFYTVCWYYMYYTLLYIGFISSLGFFFSWLLFKGSEWFYYE